MAVICGCLKTERLCRSYVHGRLFTGVGRRNNCADCFLIEALKATMALQVFEMAADGAVAQELVALLARDESSRDEAFSAFRVHSPAFAFSKGLAQEREIRKRIH